MNPFALHGPSFLFFYAVVGISALLLQFFWSRAKESGGIPSQSKMTDPYLIAYLRGDTSDALRVAAVSLMERKLLNASGRMLTAEPGAEDKVESPIEKAVLNRYHSPATAAALDSSAVAEATFQAYQAELVSHGLVAGPKTFGLRLVPFCVAAAMILGTGLAKVGIALSQGRHNVLYLIGMMIAFFLISLVLFRLRRTRAGSAMISDLQTMFEGLQARAEALPTGGAASEVAMVGAIFGIAALPETRFPGVYALKPEPSSTNDSSLWNNRDHGWSGSGSSSGGSSSRGSKLGCGG